MEIKAEGVITKEDFGIAQEYLIKKTRKEMKKKYPKLLGLFPLIIFGLLLCFLVSHYSERIKFDYKAVLYGATIVAVLFLLLTKIYMKYLKRLPSDKGVCLGKHTFLVKEDGLLEETENQTTIIKWSGVLNVEETSDMIFVYVDSIAAHIIPKHFFSNENEINEFISAIIDKCPQLHGDI